MQYGMTDTQIRNKILLYIQRKTNHRAVLAIEKENSLIEPDTKNYPEWYKVKVLTTNSEKATVYVQINDGSLFYAVKRSEKYLICDQILLNSIF